MGNERLRDALLTNHHTAASLAEQIGVDPKTVERWMSQDRTPYARHRRQVAALLGESESWLWPTAMSQERLDATSRSELVQLYPRRAAIGMDGFNRLFGGAETFIDLLVYAALFLPEQTPGVVDLLREKGAAGVRVRLLLGDALSTAVVVRGIEEGIGEDAVPIKIRNALALLKRPLMRAKGVQVRLHGATLYTSIYRGDDEMFANPHVHGLPAAQAPVLHLRRLSSGGLFDTYAAMYDRVWDAAKPAWTRGEQRGPEGALPRP